jgi:hypothetical protein
MHTSDDVTAPSVATVTNPVHPAASHATPPHSACDGAPGIHACDDSHSLSCEATLGVRNERLSDQTSSGQGSPRAAGADDAREETEDELMMSQRSALSAGAMSVGSSAWSEDTRYEYPRRPSPLFLRDVDLDLSKCKVVRSQYLSYFL